MAYKNLIENTVRWLLLGMVMVYIVTGYGITEFRIVERLTFGLLTKNLSFRIHDAIEIPFIVLLLLHLLYAPVLESYLKLKAKKQGSPRNIPDLN